MPGHDLSALNKTFALPGQLSFRQAEGGLAACDIDNAHGRATVYLQGAHLTDWTPRGQAPVFWLSPKAQFAAGKAIRGGVPVCWPWFGAHAAEPGFPAHGYARTAGWQVAETTARADGATCLRLRLPPNPALWPHAAGAEIRFTLGETLAIELLTRNPGPEAVVVSQALHSYFRVSDARRVGIHGLDGLPYLDKLDGLRKRQRGSVRIDGEVDRVYLEAAGDCLLDDPGASRRIRVAKQGSASTVVWNPGAEKARQMGDLGEGAQLGMVCVETANAADDTLSLAAGAEHALRAVFGVEGLG